VATFRVYYRLHWFLADPHPGNFIFMEDGRLGLIDFGCTRVFTDEDWRLICELERATVEHDDTGFNQVVAKACFFDGPEAMEPERLEVIRRGVLWNMEPWLKEGLFDFGDRAFFMRGIDNLMEMTRKRYTRGSPLYLWSNRFIFGGRAFCYRMKGRCEFRKIYLQESAKAEEP
jgi:predicted unusual protein kinase regulating ubiquinone biosynthesis (AarF/ABC1/UbiB family)